jgi:hypothetical protein
VLELYRQASGGECPVVFDLNTPSCGGSRFGCWTCTVIKEDKFMRGFIDSGVRRRIEWLNSLLHRPENGQSKETQNGYTPSRKGHWPTRASPGRN